MTQAKPVIQVTPEMLRAAQLDSELGAIACSQYAGAYSMIEELYRVMGVAADPAPTAGFSAWFEQQVKADRLYSDDEDVAAAAWMAAASALTARVAELEAMQEWRPISTAPRHDGDVQLYCEDTGEQFVGWRHDETRWQYAADKISGTVTVCRPSHWKPLTPAPTKDKKAECSECQGTGRTAYGYEDCPSCK